MLPEASSGRSKMLRNTFNAHPRSQTCSPP